MTINPDGGGGVCAGVGASGVEVSVIVTFSIACASAGAVSGDGSGDGVVNVVMEAGAPGGGTSGVVRRVGCV